MRYGPGRREAGFTLVELMVVIVVIGIVSTIGLLAVWNAFEKARQRSTMADMRNISKAIEIYAVDHGYLPSDAGGIDGLAAVLIPYESSTVPTLDHWRHPYHYEAGGRDYTIECYGKDGVDGTNISIATRMDFDLDIVLSDGRFVASPE